MLRRIPFEKIENFRDLGGYATDYGESGFGIVYRAGSLSDATASDIDKMAAIGIKTVIDLRGKPTVDEHPDAMKGDPRFKVYELPVNGNGRVPTSRKDMISSYLQMLEDPFTARRIFLVLAHCEKPCVIHCTAGKDRTGSFISVLLLANGVPFHDVNADYMLSFPYLTRLSRQTQRAFPDFPKAVLTPNTLFLRKVMDEFSRRYQNAEHYFEVIGIGEDDRALLCNLLGRQEKSCGAVVFHCGQVLVEHMVQGHYSIPKGHVELSDKDELATACREIKEESGLDATIIPGFRLTTDYSPKPGVVKQVVFFLAETESDCCVPQKEEVERIIWLSPSDAVRTLTHDSDRQIVIAASKFRPSVK